MPLSREAIRRRAVKTGVKASRKRHHLVTADELLSLRVQVMPALPRISMAIAGILLIVSAWNGWPSDSNAVQGVEAMVGILAILFGAFGIRRTLSQVLDSTSGEALGSILEMIGDAISNIDLNP